ncbi:MAG: recombinase family protein [Alphaproteobacteria bacterium]|nr:recombinase family protein [Alphaproteobacteria bacterium]
MKCVIYCRVSTEKQIKNGSGIESQKIACIKHAAFYGYEVIHIYEDKAKSGKNTDRDALQQMLQFLKHSQEPVVVLVYDLSRLSRELSDFSSIKKEIFNHKHSLATANNGTFNDTPESNMMANMQLSFAQYEREYGAERSKKNMKLFAEQGYWMFQMPPGYKRGKNARKNHLLRDEPLATILENALNKFASAELLLQKDVQDYLIQQFTLNHMDIPKNIQDYTKRLLMQEKYTGYGSYSKWNIPYQKWYIEPLISVYTYEQIQKRLHKITRVTNASYNETDPRFPLRGQIRCPYCGGLISGSMTKSGKYPYYYCNKTGCKGKAQINVTPDRLHKDFENLLSSISTKYQFVNVFRDLAHKLYLNHIDKSASNIKYLQAKFNDITKEIEKTFATLNEATNDLVKKYTEEQLNGLLQQQESIKEQIRRPQKEVMNFDTAFDYLLQVINNPVYMWRNGDYYIRKQLCDIIFIKKPKYRKSTLFYDYELAPIFYELDSMYSLMVDILGKDIAKVISTAPEDLLVLHDTDCTQDIFTDCRTTAKPQISGKNSPVLHINSYLVP